MLKASHNPWLESILSTSDFSISILSVDLCKMIMVVITDSLWDWTLDNSSVLVVPGNSFPTVFSPHRIECFHYIGELVQHDLPLGSLFSPIVLRLNSSSLFNFSISVISNILEHWCMSFYHYHYVFFFSVYFHFLLELHDIFVHFIL